MPDDLDLTYIFSKVIGHKLSGGSIGYLCTRCRMNFAADAVQTKTPQFMDMRFSTIDTLDKISDLSTPDTRIIRPTYGDHWIMPNHVFGETTAVGVSEAKSDYN